MSMALIGYARVSTRQQDNALQLDALARAGVDRVFEEKVSGVSKVRPQLDLMLTTLSDGDEVLVYKVDRLARSILDLRRIVDAIVASGAGFRSLTQPFDTTSSMGKLVFQMLGVLAEFERDMILERCAAGRAVAVTRGVRFGRPEAFDEDQKSQVGQLLAAGASVADVARRFGVHRQTVEKVVGRGRFRAR